MDVRLPELVPQLIENVSQDWISALVSVRYPIYRVPVEELRPRRVARDLNLRTLSAVLADGAA
jgi:hypothetical protein